MSDCRYYVNGHDWNQNGYCNGCGEASAPGLRAPGTTIEVEEGYHDGPTYIVTIPEREDGLAARSFVLMGDDEARQVIALLRRQVDKPTTWSPAEGFAAVSERGNRGSE